MNVSNLILQLKSKLSSCTIDQQMISKAIILLQLGRVESVSTYASLPSASANQGQLYYVYYDGLYWSNGSSWARIARSTLDQSWAWGFNNCGQLGDGTVNNKSSPVLVVGGFIDWCQVSAGCYQTLGVRTNGTAWAWGCNSYGRLGDGTIVNKCSPVSVVGGFTDWCQVSAGNRHSLGVRTNGTAWAWGRASSGLLGDGTTVDKSSPVSVVGGFTNWCQVSAGQGHSLGIRTNGTLWSWGCNSYGQLGDGTTVSKSSPVSVIGGFTDWCQVSAGHGHSLGVRTNGTAWAWGSNCRLIVGATGALGDGTTVNKSSPVSVVGGFTNWCQVSAGYIHSLGVRTNGTAWAWGIGSSGRLGDGTIVNKSSPVSVVGGFTDWCLADAGQVESAGIRTNGTVWTWGCNGSGFTGFIGTLGDGTSVCRSSPVSVLGGFTDWWQVSAGQCNFLAIRRPST